MVVRLVDLRTACACLPSCRQELYGLRHGCAALDPSSLDMRLVLLEQIRLVLLDKIDRIDRVGASMVTLKVPMIE